MANTCAALLLAFRCKYRFYFIYLFFLTRGLHNSWPDKRRSTFYFKHRMLYFKKMSTWLHFVIIFFHLNSPFLAGIQEGSECTKCKNDWALRAAIALLYVLCALLTIAVAVLGYKGQWQGLIVLSSPSRDFKIRSWQENNTYRTLTPSNQCVTSSYFTIIAQKILHLSRMPSSKSKFLKKSQIIIQNYFSDHCGLKWHENAKLLSYWFFFLRSLYTRPHCEA